MSGTFFLESKDGGRRKKKRGSLMNKYEHIHKKRQTHKVTSQSERKRECCVFRPVSVIQKSVLKHLKYKLLVVRILPREDV